MNILETRVESLVDEDMLARASRLQLGAKHVEFILECRPARRVGPTQASGGHLRRVALTAVQGRSGRGQHDGSRRDRVMDDPQGERRVYRLHGRGAARVAGRRAGRADQVVT